MLQLCYTDAEQGWETVNLVTVPLFSTKNLLLICIYVKYTMFLQCCYHTTMCTVFPRIEAQACISFSEYFTPASKWDQC